MLNDALLIVILGGTANMLASLSRFIFPRWNTPIDFGSGWFGDHKTWRGLIVGTLLGTCVGFGIIFNALMIQFVVPVFLVRWELLFSFFPFVVSLGALLGDLIKSFFKRRIGIIPGKSWIPFDQIDWVIGAIVGGSLILGFDWQVALVTILIGSSLHIFVNLVAYRLHLQKNKL